MSAEQLTSEPISEQRVGIGPQAWHRARRYARTFSFVGLVFATLFFSASVTPSLLPRNFIVQGLLSGFALAVGYGVGIAAIGLYHFLELRVPGEQIQLVAKRFTAVAAVIVLVICLRQMTFWQNSIRELMGMPTLESAYPIRTALIAFAFAAMLVGVSRLVLKCGAFLARKLHRFLPRRVAMVLAATIVVFAILFLGNGIVARGLLNAADVFFSHADGLIADGIEQPTDEAACGSFESSIAWNSIGRRGKEFLVQGPTRRQIQAYHGEDAMQPIRVYVGMRTREEKQDRAQLALEELQRVGAFDRSVLVIATPTGTGWLDPGGVDTIEYLHGGDTAIVSMQYSYLPSWLTIMVDPQRSIRSARELFDAVYGYWTTLPADTRPRLYLHGLSLGALGSEVSASIYKVFEDPIQGAVWSGPPFPSSQWSAITQSRDEGSPSWLPTFDDGRMVRFTSQSNALNTGQEWGKIRNVYIQYASDPMVFFSTDLLWKRPSWLDERGPDVSPYLKWYPIVTFLQIAFDLPMATSVPVGYGHNYAPANYLDAWIAVTQPENWNAAKSKQLIADLQ